MKSQRACVYNHQLQLNKPVTCEDFDEIALIESCEKGILCIAISARRVEIKTRKGTYLVVESDKPLFITERRMSYMKK